MKIAIYIILGFFALSILGVGIRIACAPAAVAHKVMNSAEGVLDKTIAPDNVIHNYEWFHDTSRAVNARVAQIQAHVRIAADEKDADERRRLRIEVAGMQQSCRDMIAQYNANTSKINRDLFRGKTAPASIDPSVCE